MKIKLLENDARFDFMGKRWIALAGSLTLIIVAIVSISIRGLSFGIDFTGGTLVELGYSKAIEPADIPNMVDRFALLTDWVENGKAPGKQVTVTGKSGSRPMCSFPTYPRFQGGDSADAASFTCADPTMGD